MHRDLLAERFERVLVRLALERDENADLAEVRRDRIVHIGHNDAVIDRDGLHAADLLVFADGGDIVGQLVGNGAAGGIVLRLQGFDIVAVGSDRDIGDRTDEVLEPVVLGDEVGFRIDLDGNALGA